jgi:hypothetical protein
MEQLYNAKNCRIIIFLLLIFTLQAQLLYSQSDTLVNGNQTVKENKVYFSNERFSLNLGTFYSANNTGITFGSKELGAGIIINFEDALGLETTNFAFRATARYNYGERRQHAIVFDYFSINRKANKTLESALEIGDTSYPIGTKIQSKYYLSIIRAKYDYTFLQDDRVSLGFSAGLFIMPISFSFKSGNEKEQKASIIAPLPVLGLRSDFLITKKLSLNQSVEFLYLKIDNFSGSILDLNFNLEYKAFKHFTIGLGINSTRLNLSATGNDYPGVDFIGIVKMDYTGVYLYLKSYI